MFLGVTAHFTFFNEGVVRLVPFLFPFDLLRGWSKTAPSLKPLFWSRISPINWTITSSEECFIPAAKLLPSFRLRFAALISTVFRNNSPFITMRSHVYSWRECNSNLIALNLSIYKKVYPPRKVTLASRLGYPRPPPWVIQPTKTRRDGGEKRAPLVFVPSPSLRASL